MLTDLEWVWRVECSAKELSVVFSADRQLITIRMPAGRLETDGQFAAFARRLLAQRDLRVAELPEDSRQRFGQDNGPQVRIRPVLADIVLNDLDVRIPLGIDRVIPEDHLAVTFHHLASVPSPGFAVGGRLSELRFEAVDTGWTSGHGAPVRGDAEAVVLAMAGRTIALPRLDGTAWPYSANG
jgi:hypothetical protein